MINLYDRLDSLLTNNVEVSLIPLEYSFTDVPGLVYNIKNGDFILEPGGTSIKTFKPEYILSIVPRPRLMGIEVKRWSYTNDGDFIHLYIDVPPIERIDPTGFHWDITNYPSPDCIKYLENDRKIVYEFCSMIYGNKNHIDRIISQPPATIIFWGNGEKTVVKTEPDDEYDLEKGILYAILKHVSTKKDYDHYLRTIDKEDDPLPPDETEETPKKKREHKYQKCPVCGQGYNLNWSRTSKLSKQGFVDIRCSGCDTLFKVKGDWNLPKWWTKLEHAVVIKGKGAISNGETN